MAWDAGEGHSVLCTNERSYLLHLGRNRYVVRGSLVGVYIFWIMGYGSHGKVQRHRSSHGPSQPSQTPLPRIPSHLALPKISALTSCTHFCFSTFDQRSMGAHTSDGYTSVTTSVISRRNFNPLKADMATRRLFLFDTDGVFLRCTGSVFL